jgi:hypothetical protein
MFDAALGLGVSSLSKLRRVVFPQRFSGLIMAKIAEIAAASCE